MKKKIKITPRIIFLLPLFFLGVIGCSSKVNVPIKYTDTIEASYTIGKPDVVDQEAFDAGGGVIVIPFVPGPNLPADKILNRAGLMIVKGVADGLQGNDHYVFLTSEDANLSDVIIEGVIQEWVVPNKKDAQDGNQKAKLAVSVRMVDRYTDDLIMTVDIIKNMIMHDKAFDRMAYEIGQDIALHLTLSQRGEGK